MRPDVGQMLFSLAVLTQVWQALHLFDQLGCLSSELISRKYANLLKFDWADHTLQVFAFHLCHYLTDYPAIFDHSSYCISASHIMNATGCPVKSSLTLKTVSWDPCILIHYVFEHRNRFYRICMHPKVGLHAWTFQMAGNQNLTKFTGQAERSLYLFIYNRWPISQNLGHFFKTVLFTNFWLGTLILI